MILALTFTNNDDHSCVYTWALNIKNIRLARHKKLPLT